ncbi:hypothetical protein NDA18_005026 [Ustilago nuda]|nr:hypothetical protein NDA18_005026 [Ustilago nuda]
MEAAKRRFVMGNPEDELGKSKQTDNAGRGVTIEATTPLWLPTGGAVTTKPPLRLLAFILTLKPLFLVATIQERIQDCGGTWSGGLTSQS